nr:NAD-dependent succinate-semialdehyde dehydrogenase [Sphingomonas sp. Y57]
MNSLNGKRHPRTLVIERALIGRDWIELPIRVAVTDPATGAVIGEIPDCGTAETRAAIDAADKAATDWRARAAPERAALLRAWHVRVLKHSEALARLLTAEQGKPLAEALDEIRYAASFIAWFAGEAERIGGYDVPALSPDRRVLVARQPVGVIAAITPWNFPAAMVTRKLAPALAAGCTIVLKPSELTPFTALALARLALESGIPPGVINVVTGTPAPIGEVLMASDCVRKLSFTGSTSVGRQLMRDAAGTIKRLSLELGGNAPFIVFDDAHLEAAVAGAIASKFRNAGQTCVCANRLLVQSGIHDRFVTMLGEAVSALNVGDGFDPAVTTGPLIHAEAAAKVRAHADDALAKGAQLVAQAPLASRIDSYAAPMLLIGATSHMRVAHEETFGPLAAVFRFDDEADAVALANSGAAGLAAYFYTSDIARAWRVGDALEYGMVGINSGSVSLAAAPFGGVKQSGLGREGGREGIDEYLEIKALHWAGLR